MKLTPKQQLFADYYIESPNATEAYKRAYPNCKKDETARANASRLLTKANVLAYIDETMKQKAEKRVAQQDEILTYLSSVMRGEQTEQTLRGVGEGAQTIDEIEVSAKDRIKAAELLLKRFPMSKSDELKEHLIAAQIKKMEAEIDNLTAGDIDDKFEIVIKRKGIDD